MNLSYHNDKKLKSMMIKEMKAHEKADAIGWPEWLCILDDKIFEGLEIKKAKIWPRKLIEAVPIGKNLEIVKWKFCAFILKENIERVLALEIEDELKKEVVDAIRKVLNLHEKAVEIGGWDVSAAESAWSARSAARSAAWSAWSAESAARSAARSAAWSAWSAESAAKSAAWSAWSAESAAWSARSAKSAAKSAAWSAWSAESAAKSAAWSARSAESAAYERYANELLRLLRELCEVNNEPR